MPTYGGAEFGASGIELLVPFVILAVAVVILVSALASRAQPAPSAARVLAPGLATTRRGGDWQVLDDENLLVEPNRVHAFRVTYTPDSAFEAVAVRALLRATETYWVNESQRDADGTTRSHRERETEVVREIAADAALPARFEPGVPVTWDLAFDLDGLVPSTAGDPDLLACEWALEVTIDRAFHGDCGLSQPVIVTQPRARLNSGIVEEAQFSRYEQTRDAAGELTVNFTVHPAPLDLAATATVRLAVANTGQPVRCRSARLEIVAHLEVSDEGGDSGERVVWTGLLPLKSVDRGETALDVAVPAINATLPDADLRHGRIRGEMRLVLDVPMAPDAVLRRDLCLCLDSPRRLAGVATAVSA